MKKLTDCEWIVGKVGYTFNVYTNEYPGCFYFTTIKESTGFCKLNGFRYKVVKP